MTALGNPLTEQLLEALVDAYSGLLSLIPTPIKVLIAIPLLIFLLPIAGIITLLGQLIVGQPS
jgi:hypothetical protein